MTVTMGMESGIAALTAATAHLMLTRSNVLRLTITEVHLSIHLC